MEPPFAQPELFPIEMREVAVGAMHAPGKLVAEHVNWTVAAGDFWVIAGLQGSGKSDFLWLTGGLTQPLGGIYRLFGESMPIFEDARLATRLRLGLVFEGGQLLNHLSVWENVALPLSYHGNLDRHEARPRLHDWFEAMDLAAWADSTPGALARNWQKRVGLARALILEPEILLVDDPLAGLDLRHAQWWLSFLNQLSVGHPLLHHRPMTLVVSTSDLRPWEGRGRQFATLSRQRLNLLGTWGDLAGASSELVRELLILEPRNSEAQ